jgi:Icc-related predicted phosphoesterase
MRIVCISDTHALHNEMEHSIPEGDILIHAGDCTNVGDLPDLIDFKRFLNKQPHKYKVVISGNHDWCFSNFAWAGNIIIDQNTFYLRDCFIEIEGLKIYGSPYTPNFYNWAFMEDDKTELKRRWSFIPNDTDVLVTHGPPFYILDRTEDLDRAGSQTLEERLQDLKNLKLHVFGHIHEAYGVKTINKTTFVNASICTRKYKPKNKPIVIDL